MRKLHLVGLTTDRDGLIFTARKGSKSGGYIVPLDEKVLAALSEAESARNGTDQHSDAPPSELGRRAGRSASALTPREMQARLRAGRSIREVADEAGVDSDWVARFAVPILAEQAQVVELARGLTYAKPRLGESAQPLGASVVQNLSDKGVYLPDDLADVGWSAFQLHDSVWMVRFRYRSRGRDQEAHWELDVPAARLVARNRHASDLGYVDAVRRRRAMADDDEAVDDVEAPSRPAPRAAKARKAAKATRAGARPRPAAKRTGARKAAAPAPRARATKAAPARAGAASKARTATVPPAAKVATAGRAAKAAPAAKRRAVKAPAPGKVGAVKARPVRAGTARSGTVRAGTTRAGAGKSGAAKTPARRRPAKADTAPDGGPAAGTGGVRLAVARVSTARVAASMASAERAPWKSAVRPRAGARPRPQPAPGASAGAGVDHEGNGRNAAASREVPAFRPRPLPEGVDFDTPRTRRSPPARARVPKGEPPPVILPAPRAPAPDAPPIPAERVKRRRLRSR